MSDRYDAIVIGSGQGGGPLAGALAKAGRHVALVESEHVGGTCVNEGCTPTKTMIASARVAHLARRAADYGVQAGDGEVRVDLERVRQRKRDMVESFRSGSESSLRKLDTLDLLMGTGRFTAPHEIRVELGGGGSRTLTAPTIVIDVGTRPTLPPIDGLDDVPYLTNASLMELGEVPEHLLVIGGGYVGVEFAQAFRRFGSRVTLLQREPQLLTREDGDVAEALTDVLRDEGIDVRLNAEVGSVARVDGGVRLTAAVDGERRTAEGSHLLVAAGRRPNTDALGLDRAGIELTERGFVPVDDRLRTRVDGVYALGDVTGGPAFTHTSYDDYRILASDMLGDGSRRGTGERILAYTVYTDPQLGRVGLSEREARNAGFEVRVATLPMSRVARALETGETRGLMKAVVDADTLQILGAAMLGSEGGELAAAIQIAMLGKLPYTTLRDAPIAHPSYAESLNNLFATL
ncbi:MAG TPA: mercuric reductase [Trueperaceae bacterium]|nr:mercuric reductase [Trueperaceae bacterium]